MVLLSGPVAAEVDCHLAEVGYREAVAVDRLAAAVFLRAAAVCRFVAVDFRVGEVARRLVGAVSRWVGVARHLVEVVSRLAVAERHFAAVDCLSVEAAFPEAAAEFRKVAAVASHEAALVVRMRW